MTVKPILDSANNILHQKSKQVTKFDDAFQALVDDLIDTLNLAKGQGLAAPQIGVLLSVAVIYTQDNTLIVIVNPKITQMKGEYEPDEGCLSIPGYRGQPKRALKVTIKALDRYGNKFRMKASGVLAQAFQHEIDHLNGILYTSRITSPTKLRKKTLDEMMESHNRPSLTYPK